MRKPCPMCGWTPPPESPSDRLERLLRLFPPKGYNLRSPWDKRPLPPKSRDSHTHREEQT
jgi:hypothetical protein